MIPDLAAEDLTEDAFLGEKLMIRQPRSGYRAGIDAVLLAAAAPVSTGQSQSYLDCGAGVGTVGLCLAARVTDARVTLIEREQRLATVATGNAARNGLTDRVRVVIGDLTHKAAGPLAPRLEADSFDHVLANPPYHVIGEGTPAADPLKSVSHAMPDDQLDLWARFMARMAKPGGTATLIHKADSLLPVLQALEPRFGNLKVLPIYARDGEPAIRVVVQGIKASRAPLTLLPGFVLHDASNDFTARAVSILRQGGDLALSA